MANQQYNHGDVVLRFSNVSFAYNEKRPILNGVNFSVRERAKITLMGQNGAGKSTIFNLILGKIKLDEGAINIKNGASIGIASQAIKKDDLQKTVTEFFEGAFDKKIYDIEPKIKKILKVVNLGASLTKKIGAFSGGEQARLLLAYALIQNPDILLLDEPTNNLDKTGIEHLTKFLIDYEKTVIVISHDAHFLNSFTDGVLYLDAYQQKVEQYVGDYLKVVAEIMARIERERRENVRLQKDIIARKEQMNFFAQKGGHMRDVARKMREAIEELEGQLVELREEDKTIGKFQIPVKEISGTVIELSSVTTIKNGKHGNAKTNIILKTGDVLLIKGPNGIGKTTLLKKIANHTEKGAILNPESIVGYYTQDFSGLEENKTVYQTLSDVMDGGTEGKLRSVAAHFLFTDDLLRNHVGSLSEGQKGLLTFARFVLQMPNLLILDEPTNHINFRHLPIIAKALDEYRGALILVSHMPEFLEQIKVDQILDLGNI